MKWYQYLEDAKKIPELYNSISEIAKCENKRIEDYSISFFVETAKNLLDVFKCCESNSAFYKQTELLNEYVKRYEIKENDSSVEEWLKEHCPEGECNENG